LLYLFDFFYFAVNLPEVRLVTGFDKTLFLLDPAAVEIAVVANKLPDEAKHIALTVQALLSCYLKRAPGTVSNFFPVD
jgi:hypothetical protein